MNLPSLPTDNLYKFLALSGLFIVLFSFIFPMNRIGELELKSLEINTQAEVLRIEIDYLKTDTTIWGKKAKLDPEETVLIRKRTREAEIKAAELKGKMEQIEVLRKEVLFYWKFLRITYFLGTAISLVGFCLWYILVQRPNDILLRKQVKKDKI
jgi:hypothetical protein